MIGTLRVKPDSMRRAAEHGFMLATDLADYLVKKGETFRSAHEYRGRLVTYAIQEAMPLDRLSLDEYRRFSPRFRRRRLLHHAGLARSAARDNIGGTAPQQVSRALGRRERIVGE